MDLTQSKSDLWHDHSCRRTDAAGATVSLLLAICRGQSGNPFRERHRNLRTEHEIGLDTKGLVDEVAVAPDQDRGRRAAQREALHRDRNMRMFVRKVDSDGRRDPVFMEEGLERDGRHRRMMLENRMNADDGEFGLTEDLVELVKLRDRVRYATRAKSLQGMQEHRSATQTCERDRPGRVEPLADGEFRRLNA